MNEEWIKQSQIYFDKSPTCGKFCGEFNFIRKEIGLLEGYFRKE